ncbi:MAG: ferredoxin [Bacteroidales bacterium]
MAIKIVWIEEECTSCGLCEDIYPEVFKMEDLAEVKNDADFEANEDNIIEAAESCLLEVIKDEE